VSPVTTPLASSAELLLAAEDHFVHGHLLSGWITDYIDLEESLAVGSIAQEELAHAATLMNVHGLDDVGRDAFVYQRPVEQWWPTRLLAHRLHDWPSTVVRGLLLAHAAVVRSERMSAAEEPAVRDAGVVLAAEQRLHVLHWQRWVHLLGGDPRTADELRQRAAVVLPLARDVFGSSSSSDTPRDREAHTTWVCRVDAVLREVDVPVGALGDVPTARSCADQQPELLQVLADVRLLRTGTGVGDGVRGLDR
jgi:1,2-phenylacetyl-CoA epoxidase catalytic subunit